MVDDGQRTDDGRTTEHGYTISSLCEPDGSGELKTLFFTIKCAYKVRDFRLCVTRPLLFDPVTHEP